MITATNMAVAMAKAAQQCKVDHHAQRAWVKRHVETNLERPGGPGVRVVKDNVHLKYKTAVEMGMAK